jgi:hypothetical protein
MTTHDLQRLRIWGNDNLPRQQEPIKNYAPTADLVDLNDASEQSHSTSQNKVLKDGHLWNQR